MGVKVMILRSWLELPAAPSITGAVFLGFANHAEDEYVALPTSNAAYASWDMS